MGDQEILSSELIGDLIQGQLIDILGSLVQEVIILESGVPYAQVGRTDDRKACMHLEVMAMRRICIKRLIYEGHVVQGEVLLGKYLPCHQSHQKDNNQRSVEWHDTIVGLTSDELEA